MGRHQPCPSLQELEICLEILSSVHTRGQDANMQAKEGAVREDNLSSKLITWKDRTECGFHWCYLRLWDLEANSQIQHGRAMTRYHHLSRGLGNSSGWRDGAELAMGFVWASRPPCPLPVAVGGWGQMGLVRASPAAGEGAADLHRAHVAQWRRQPGRSHCPLQPVPSFCFKGTSPKQNATHLSFIPGVNNFRDD